MSWVSTPISGNFGFPLGAATGALVTIVAVAAHATRHPTAPVIALAVCVAGIAVLTTPAAALGTAVVCWFLQAGFVVGREGTVSLTAVSARDAAVLAVTAVGMVAVMAALRAIARALQGERTYRATRVTARPQASRVAH